MSALRVQGRTAAVNRLVGEVAASESSERVASGEAETARAEQVMEHRRICEVAEADGQAC